MIFEVRNGFFGYGKENILNDVSFSLEEGEVLSVLGPNGVGKTTMLKCMMGLLNWCKGSSYLNGENIQDISMKELWKTIAYVPQAKNSAFSFTALEMVTLGRNAHLSIFKQPGEKEEKMALQAMKDVGIEYLKNKQCSQMSGGELQMVLIARALIAEPQLLVLDEPESNLDFKNQLIVLETISRLAKEKNISAIVNTHYPEHALKIADKALVLQKSGKTVFGKAADVITAETMIEAFDVQVYINRFKYEENSDIWKGWNR